MEKGSAIISSWQATISLHALGNADLLASKLNEQAAWQIGLYTLKGHFCRSEFSGLTFYPEIPGLAPISSRRDREDVPAPQEEPASPIRGV
jgi:hypothetical protein